MVETLLILNTALLAALVAAVWFLLRRNNSADLAGVQARVGALDASLERVERGVRDEIGRSRNESAAAAQALRQEVAATLQGLGEAVNRTLGTNAQVQKDQLEAFASRLTHLTDTGQANALALRQEITAALTNLGDGTTRTLTAIAEAQKNQLDAFAGRLAQLTDTGQANARHLREEMGASLKGFNDSVLKSMGEIATLQKNQLDVFASRLSSLTASTEQSLQTLRQTLEQQLRALQDDNAKRLEQMRATVDEKLQGTLEKRLGESFKLVSDRLELVHKGLGEMQSLASGVGDLKRVLSNVKTRGILGEIQLGNLLEQLLTPEQFGRNVATRPGSAERVEFAIRFPGRTGDALATVWLPIDAKFPQEDYQRLVEAAERADAAGVETAGRQLDGRIKLFAREIQDKYLETPYTTDFGIMFLPTEGLFAEVVRRPALVESLQRECHVMVAGPTTLAAILNSLQMGFRTLAIEKRSSEVWTVLGTVKTEFGKFGDILDNVKKKLEQATNTIDDAARKSRTIERKLRGVEEVSAAEAAPTLMLGPAPVDGAEES